MSFIFTNIVIICNIIYYYYLKINTKLKFVKGVKIMERGNMFFSPYQSFNL